MKRHQNHIKIIVEVIRYAFIVLFTYASVSKLLDHETFRIQLGQSPIIAAYSQWMVWSVPLSELITVLLLVLTKLLLTGFYACLILMSMFTAYIFLILKFSPYIPCSCGGILNSMGWTEHLVFNMVFVLLSILGIHLLSYTKHSHSYINSISQC